MSESYYPYSNIKMESTSDEYIRKVKGCLNRILSMARGAEFLTAINSSGRTLTVKGWGGGDSGNSCGMNIDGYALLSKAIKRDLSAEFTTELGKAVAKAEASGMKRDFFASQLSEGVLPTTHKTSDNIGAPKSRVQVPQVNQGSGKTIMDYHGQKATEARTFLDELIAGTRSLSDVPAEWKNDLQRLLRNFLRPGPGCSCNVYFNPNDFCAASGNAAVKNRPPTIGLAHEMVHAYRAMHGLTVYVYYNGDDLEEVITSGFPPYQYEKFSENIFRTQYKGDEQRIRTNY